MPWYMIPQHFIEIDAIPLTPAGKINRKQLVEDFDPKISAEGKPCHPPKSPTEIMIAEIWKDILSVDRINIEDNFFAIGGHSILSTRVVSRIREKINVNLSMQNLFEYPTISMLAGYIDHQIRREEPMNDLLSSDKEVIEF